MDEFAYKLIKKMFDFSNYGVAFNIMSTKVNYKESHLYYHDPLQMFSYCLSEITRYIRVEHSYPAYEYTIYLYKQ